MTEKEGFIWAPDLTDEEAELFDVWSARCHEIAKNEGQPIDIIGGAHPILLGILQVERPQWSTEERFKTSVKFTDVLLRAISLTRDLPEGNS